MARELTGIVRPELDDRALDREMSTLEKRMGEASRIAPDLDLKGIGRKLENLMPGGRQFRRLRQTIGSIRGSDGGRSRSTGGSTTDKSIAAAQLETLDDIHDELEKIGTSGGIGGGGGGGGGFGKGVLASQLLRNGGGGLAGMLSSAKGVLGRSGAASLMLSGQFGKGGLMQRDRVPGDRERGPGAKALADIGRGEFEVQMPDELTNFDWPDPPELPDGFDGFEWPDPPGLPRELDTFEWPEFNLNPPQWMRDLFGLEGGSQQPDSGVNTSEGGDQRLLNEAQENRAKGNRGGGVNFDLGGIEVNLNPRDLQELRRDLENNAVDRTIEALRKELNL